MTVAVSFSLPVGSFVDTAKDENEDVGEEEDEVEVEAEEEQEGWMTSDLCSSCRFLCSNDDEPTQQTNYNRK